MAPLRVLVCGSNYGAAYFHAVSTADDRYRPVGLLARGSERSRRLAERFGVPLVTTPDLAPQADLACAALGIDAHAVAVRLLERGIAVLCEHPLPAAAVQSALEAARAAGTRVHVNGHWADVDPAPRFIEEARRRCRAAPPLHLHVTLSDRMLYGALDVVGRIFGATPPELEVAARTPPFVLLQGRLGGIDATVRIETTERDGRRLEDGSPDYTVCHRVALELADGALSFLGPGGPVIWNANEFRAQEPDRALWEVCDAGPTTTRRLSAARAAANRRALDRLAADVASGACPAEQEPDYLLSLSAGWEAWGRALAG